MLTSYMVTCPHPGCDWFGSLLPCQDTAAWNPLIPTTAVAVFQCPVCHTEWRARIVGDDVESLHEHESEADLHLV
jgi:hypothetical protein